MINEKLQLLGQPVRACLEGHMVTVFITDYDPSSDSYNGESHRNYSMNTGENPPIVKSVPGLRPYPYTERPDYAFQFVRPGEDESVLLAIAQNNVHLPDNFNSPEQVEARKQQVLNQPKPPKTKTKS